MSYNKNNTEQFYRDIIQKVYESVKEDFQNEGIGEDVLMDMKKLWQDKLIQSGIFQRQATPNFYIKSNDPHLMMGNGVARYNPNMNERIPYNYLAQAGMSTIPFKSGPHKTTSDNIKSYMGYMETSRPKFTTITTPHPKPFVEQSLNDGSIINSTLHPVKQEEDDDSDLDIFEGQNKKEDAKKEDNLSEEESVLSPILSESPSDEAKDFLLAQYEKVHRVRNKWKCTFKDAILHINEKEYVFEKVVGELERDW